MSKTLIHGENIFKPVKTVPSGEKSLHTVFIAGHSESGHHHVLESKTEFEVITPEDKQELYIRLFEPAKVVHKKSFEIHETKVLQAGLYEVYPAEEYNPFEQIMQKQWD